MNKGADPAVKAQAVALYRQKVPVQKIALQLGVKNKSTISRWAKEAGVKLRQIIPKREGKYVTPDPEYRSVDAYAINGGTEWQRSWAEHTYALEPV